jgi:hypothetical protein
MRINNLNSDYLYKNLLLEDNNKREINIYNIRKVQLTGPDIFYPNCLFYSNNILLNPINEVTMSLKNLDSDCEYHMDFIEIKQEISDPVFFFVYNTDNYYHFLYDTLPYLISYKNLKKNLNNLKLLMNYPNYESDKFYTFVLEFLDIIGIKNDDIIIARKDVIYDNIYVSSSYTHGHNSNLPPREEIYEFYKDIVNIVESKNSEHKEYPKKIYISRRTWIHNDLSNIGTNYTSKRKLTNEDELVDILIQNGYTEVFTEKLSTIEKIKMFSNAESVIGAIGGGLCNVLFCNNTKLLALISPTFLDINKRFLYSFSNVDTTLFTHTEHLEKGFWKRYMRVKTNNGIIGEIEDILNDKLLIIYTDKKIAGWNSQLNLNKDLFNMSDCVNLDNGLNSPWTINIEKIKEII